MLEPSSHNPLSVSTKRSYRTASQWQSLINDHKASGLSCSEFCKQNQIVLKTFLNWRKKLAPEGSDVPFSQSNFIEIVGKPQTQTARQKWDAELDLGNGMILRFSTGANA